MNEEMLQLSVASRTVYNASVVLLLLPLRELLVGMTSLVALVSAKSEEVQRSGCLSLSTQLLLIASKYVKGTR
jgi:hypothetical protein